MAPLTNQRKEIPKRGGIPLKLMTLPQDQKDQLIDWLFDEKLTYAKALQRLKNNFGVSSSMNGICRFWQDVEKQRRDAKSEVEGEVLEITIRVRLPAGVSREQVSVSLPPQ